VNIYSAKQQRAHHKSVCPKDSVNRHSRQARPPGVTAFIRKLPFPAEDEEFGLPGQSLVQNPHIAPLQTTTRSSRTSPRGNRFPSVPLFIFNLLEISVHHIIIGLLASIAGFLLAGPRTSPGSLLFGGLFVGFLGEFVRNGGQLLHFPLDRFPFRTFHGTLELLDLGLDVLPGFGVDLVAHIPEGSLRTVNEGVGMILGLYQFALLLVLLSVNLCFLDKFLDLVV